MHKSRYQYKMSSKHLHIVQMAINREVALDRKRRKGLFTVRNDYTQKYSRNDDISVNNP